MIIESVQSVMMVMIMQKVLYLRIKEKCVQGFGFFNQLCQQKNIQLYQQIKGQCRYTSNDQAIMGQKHHTFYQSLLYFVQKFEVSIMKKEINKKFKSIFVVFYTGDRPMGSLLAHAEPNEQDSHQNSKHSRAIHELFPHLSQNTHVADPALGQLLGVLVHAGQFLAAEMHDSLHWSIAPTLAEYYLLVEYSMAHFSISRVALLCTYWRFAWKDMSAAPQRKQAQSSTSSEQMQFGDYFSINFVIDFTFRLLAPPSSANFGFLRGVEGGDSSDSCGPVCSVSLEDGRLIKYIIKISVQICYQTYKKLHPLSTACTFSKRKPKHPKMRWKMMKTDLNLVRHKVSNQLAKSCRNSSSRSVSNLLRTTFFQLHRLFDFVTIISILVSFALSASLCSYFLSATQCEQNPVLPYGCHFFIFLSRGRMPLLVSGLPMHLRKACLLQGLLNSMKLLCVKVLQKSGVFQGWLSRGSCPGMRD